MLQYAYDLSNIITERNRMTKCNTGEFSVDEEKQLRAFIEILDQAYLSENSAVKDALHQLMMITILCHGHKKSKRGPFKELFNKIKRIEDKLDNLILAEGQKKYDDLQNVLDGYKDPTYKTYTTYTDSTIPWKSNTTKTFDTNDFNWTTTSAINCLPAEVTDQLTGDQLSAFFDTSSSKTTVKK